jgi:Rieske Fe-S protein
VACGPGGAPPSGRAAAQPSSRRPHLRAPQAAADVLAMASLEVDMSGIAEGDSVTVKWRGKPVFIRHRWGAWALAGCRGDAAQPDRAHLRVGSSRRRQLPARAVHAGGGGAPFNPPPDPDPPPANPNPSQD